MDTQRIDRLHTHAIQTYRLLEGLRVILTTCIQHADSLDELTLRNATTIVTNGDTQIVVDGDLQAVASLHLELVDGVVDDFLQQHVDTIFWQRAVAQASDIHSWTGTDVFHVRQVSDIIVSIIRGVGCWVLGVSYLFFHNYSFSCIVERSFASCRIIVNIRLSKIFNSSVEIYP